MPGLVGVTNQESQVQGVHQGCWNLSPVRLHKEPRLLSTIRTHIGLIPDEIHPAAMIPVRLHHGQVELIPANRLTNRTNLILELLDGLVFRRHSSPLSIEGVGIPIDHSIVIVIERSIETKAELVSFPSVPGLDLVVR